MLDYLKLPRWLLGKYHVIHNGLAATGTNESQARDKSPRPTVLAVGTLHPRKGYETLIHAFKQVVQRLPAAECLIVGGNFGDGAYGQRLRELTHSLGLDGHVKFIGYSPDVHAYMRQCSLLAVPSRIEAFGMVAIEAMLAGKPVVACRTGGLKEIVAHRETGALVEPGNPTAMAIALIEILCNRGLAHRMGRAGRDRVLNQFTLEKMTAAFAHFYGSLLAPA
jgi:hypothetical protein